MGSGGGGEGSGGTVMEEEGDGSSEPEGSRVVVGRKAVRAVDLGVAARAEVVKVVAATEAAVAVVVG